MESVTAREPSALRQGVNPGAPLMRANRETGFRIGAGGETYYTDQGRKTRKTSFLRQLREAARYGAAATRGGARGASRLGQGAVHTASRYSTGLNASELSEYRRLKRMENEGVFTRDETYLLEVKRLKALEKRYLATTGKRKAQLGNIYRRAKHGPNYKRLRA